MVFDASHASRRSATSSLERRMRLISLSSTERPPTSPRCCAKRDSTGGVELDDPVPERLGHLLRARGSSGAGRADGERARSLRSTRACSTSRKRSASASASESASSASTRRRSFSSVAEMLASHHDRRGGQVQGSEPVDGPRDDDARIGHRAEGTRDAARFDHLGSTRRGHRRAPGRRGRAGAGLHRPDHGQRQPDAGDGHQRRSGSGTPWPRRARSSPATASSGTSRPRFARRSTSSWATRRWSS